MQVESQRYISDELSHFVGRGMPSEADQYSVLLKILNEGWLTHPPHNRNVSGNIVVASNARLSDNQMYTPQVICFCDIPFPDLKIHTHKYSRFGLSFSRGFIIEKGGAPVRYVPRSAAYEGTQIGDYFDKMVSEYHQLLNDLPKNAAFVGGNLDSIMRMDSLRHFFDFQFFSHLKFYDDRKPEGDPDNYYLEREWRVRGNINFVIDDVRTVFLPRPYSRQFKDDCPMFAGQIILFDDDLQI